MLGGFQPSSSRASYIDNGETTTSVDNSVEQNGDASSDDDDEDIDDDNNDESNDSLLDFREIERAEDPPISSFKSAVRVRRRILLHLDEFCYGPLADGISEFLTRQLRERQGAIRAWTTVTFEFVRETLEGVQNIAAPFALGPVYLADEGAIGEAVSRLMSSLLERVALFISSGSGWAVLDVLHVQCDLLYLPHHLNNIGYSRAANNNRLFGANACYHLGGDGSAILSKVVFNLCDNSNFCFPTALGASLHPNLPAPLSGLSNNAIISLRQQLLDLAFSAYDFSDIQSYPCNFEQIRNFIRTNESKVLISLVGMSRKKAGPSRNEVRRRHRLWPIFQTSDFLRKSLTSGLPSVYLLVNSELQGANTPSTYHVSFIKSFQDLMKCVSPNSSNKFFCPSCFGSIRPEKVTQHSESCHTQSSNGEVFTEINFFPPGHEYRFSMKLNACCINILGAFDIETTRIPVDDRQCLGELTDCLYKFEPISYSASLAFNNGVETLPQLYPKTVISKDCIAYFYEQCMIELCFLQTTLKKTKYPIHMTREEKNARYTVTHCSNCQRKFRGVSEIIAHHLHSQRYRNFLGYVCQVIFCHFLFITFKELMDGQKDE